MTRTAAVPPQLTGFTPVRLIGVGGYADVYLYEQQMPQRNVAVKVLVADKVAGSQQRAQFTAEANLMARVSTHPYIVSIFDASISSDGRPYLVMEYYPGLNFLERARRERLSVAMALRTGIQIASAIETAHRAGVLHRDIKPANILTSEYGRPGLTDFGIAATDTPTATEAEGMSVPWAPPEAFGMARLDERADIYSLAATVYHLVAGRSPYEIPSGSNSSLDLMNRIERQPLPAIGRPDVPPSLERVLAIAMAKDPSHRPATAAEFGRLLQEVEAELHLPVTQLELADLGNNVRLRDDLDAEDATRIKGVTTIDAQQVPVAIDSIPREPGLIAPPVQRAREGMLAEPAVPETVLRPAPHPAPGGAVSPTASGRGSKLPVLIGAGVAVVAAVIIGVVALGGGGSEEEPTATVPVNDGFDEGFSVSAGPEPVQAVGVADNGDGTFTATWTPADDADPSTRYQVREFSRSDETAEVVHDLQSELTLRISSPCAEVVAVASGKASVPVEGCNR